MVSVEALPVQLHKPFSAAYAVIYIKEIGLCLHYKLNTTGEPLEIFPFHTFRNLFSVV